MGDFETMAIDLRDAWRRYRDLFGEDPHGTPQQMRALLALTRTHGAEAQSKPQEPMLLIPLSEARLIRKVFLPANPRKMKSPHPDTLATVCHYISALNLLESESGAWDSIADGSPPASLEPYRSQSTSNCGEK